MSSNVLYHFPTVIAFHQSKYKNKVCINEGILNRKKGYITIFFKANEMNLEVYLDKEVCRYHGLDNVFSNERQKIYAAWKHDPYPNLTVTNQAICQQ